MKLAEPPYHPVLPVMSHEAYGVRLELCEEGDWIAAGHVPVRRFVAAANKVARTEFGLTNLWDDATIGYEDATDPVVHVWAVRCPKCTCPGDCENGFHDYDSDPDVWHLSCVDHEGNPVTSETPGAQPYTFARP